MSASLTPSGNVAAPSFETASQPGEIVGFNLQNAGSTALAAQPITFAETFAPGTVQPGGMLTAQIDGQTYAVQMDAKTFNPDGSVAMALLTIDAPGIPAGTTIDGMISSGGSPTVALPSSDVSLLNALSAGNYSLSANLVITANAAAGGAIGSQTVDIAKAVETALQNGSAKIWMSGPLAQEAIVSIPVTGSLRIEADVTAYANGKISATLQFNNDAAMSSAGGTITYSATVTQNGTTVLTQPNLTQYQYQDWSATVGTVPPSAGLNVQENIAYLEAQGVVPNYDTQYGVSSGLISGGNSNEASQIQASTFGKPLQPDGITQYMPGVGGRGDIGATTQYNAEWLITQNATNAAYAEAQAGNGDGSIPWHYYDPTSAGAFLVPGSPGDGKIWTDGRGGPGSYTTGLTQQISNNTGWALDQAHQPDLAYDAYIQTGNVQYLEQVNAQASFSLSNQWPGSRNITDPATGVQYNDIVTTGEQVRGAAWSLRQIDEAAFINPAGSASKAYFMSAAVDNWTYLDSMIPTWTAEEGQAHGYLIGAYGSNNMTMAPWQQDYLASSTVEAAQMGIKGALTFLAWSANYLVGRFFAEPQGYNPEDAFTYNIAYGNGTTVYKNWSQIEQGTMGIGQSNVGANWAHAVGDYGALALQSLAGIISVSTSSAAGAAALGSYQYQALQAYAWTLSSGAPYVLPNLTAGSTPQFEISPRLANGQLLSDGNITISTDTQNVILEPNVAGQNALITAGSGNDVLVGGTGINVLQGGAGADTLIGGPNGNYIFAGAGDSTVIAGGGATFIQASSTALLAPGVGKDLFVINEGAAGAVTISGFNASLDHIDIVDAAGTSISASQLTAIEATATSVAGGTLYRVSSNETLFVEGSVPGSASWFSEQNQALTVSGAISGGLTQTGAPTGGSGGSGGGGSSGGSGGSNGGNGYSPPPATSITGGAYPTIPGAYNAAFVDSISGSAVNATMTGQTETVTMTGGSNTIDAVGGPGKGMYPTYGNIIMTGDNNSMSVTGGQVTVTGSKNSIVVPYTYGSLSVTLDGTADTVSTSSFTSPVLNIEGSDNVANFNSESVTDTIGGANNTVSAGTYSIIDVTGKGDNVTLLGETRATVSGSGDTINAGTGYHSIDATNSTGTPNVYEIGGSVGGSVTIAGFNPAVDHLRVFDASGAPLGQSAIDQVIAGAATVAGSPNVVKLNAGTTVLYLDLAAGVGSVSPSWFEPSPAGPSTIDGGVIIQNGASQTVLGAYANITDSISGATIDARRTHQQETVTLTGSSDTVDAVGAAGSTNFPTYGNLFLTGDKNTVSVTAGTTTDTGNGNAITVPWQFGGGSVIELGTNATISAGANTSVPIDIAGSGNTATINAQSALQTVGGSNNTVTAGVYARVDMTGSGNRLNVSGEAAVTVSGGSPAGAADTIQATGFDNIITKGGNTLISIPGGSWNSVITAAGGNDTVVVGPAATGGSNRLHIRGGEATLDVQNHDSQRTITMTRGSGAVTATGGANGDVFIGGSKGRNYLASDGNSTLIGNGGSNTLAGGGADILMKASTTSGASNMFLFDKSASIGVDTIKGFGGSASNTIVLQSGLSITSHHVVASKGTPGMMLQLNDGSKIMLTHFSGSLVTKQTALGTSLTA